MSEFRPSIDAPSRHEPAPCQSSRERFLLGLAVFTLVLTSKTPAAEQAAVINAKVDAAPVNFGPILPASSVLIPAPALTPAPGVFTMPTSGGVPVFSTTDFRPRKRTLFDRDPAVSAFTDAPMIHYTTVWQQLSEYKSHDRVQVLTLWESSGSSVSLQAGKRGDPSLQWTSRVMNRGGSTRGLLDRFFSASIAGAASGFHNSSNRSSNAPAAAPKAAPPPVAAALK
jgi:hypothetical protein